VLNSLLFHNQCLLSGDHIWRLAGTLQGGVRSSCSISYDVRGIILPYRSILFVLFLLIALRLSPLYQKKVAD